MFWTEIKQKLRYSKILSTRYCASNTFCDIVSVHGKLNRNFTFDRLSCLFSLKCAQDQGLPETRVNNE